jgi:hypothetical protein
MEPDLGRGLADAQELGGLGGREPFDISKQDRQAEPVRESLEGGGQLGPLLGPLGSGRRIRRVAAQGPVLGGQLVGGQLVQADLPPPGLGTAEVQGAADSDPVEPGADLGVAPETTQATDGPDVGFLGGVGSVVGVLEDPLSDAEDLAVGRGDQRSDGTSIAGSGRPDHPGQPGLLGA